MDLHYCSIKSDLSQRRKWIKELPYNTTVASPTMITRRSRIITGILTLMDSIRFQLLNLITGIHFLQEQNTCCKQAQRKHTHKVSKCHVYINYSLNCLIRQRRKRHRNISNDFTISCDHVPNSIYLSKVMFKATIEEE